MRDILPEITGIICIILLIVALLLLIYKNGLNREDKLWNGGYCSVCGGAWKYEQAVGHRSSTSYIYVCENCGKRIELFEVR
jgi:hypothetical protein